MKHIGVIGGGNSGEREVSLKSLENVCQELKKTELHIYPLISSGKQITYQGQLIDLNDFSWEEAGQKIHPDAIYNTIHGTPGENGLLQGYFDLLGIPYSSCDTFVSSLTFNKDFCKKALQEVAGVYFAPSVTIRKGDVFNSSEIAQKLGFPCFVKPNNGGSSVATAKVRTEEELTKAIEAAYAEDSEAIVEAFIEGTEITCGVARIKGKIQALAITEIVSKLDFFDYAAKYTDSSTEEITPARIDAGLYKHCMERCEYIYQFLGCKGIIRIDFIVKDNKIYFLEVNTTPGMTNRSLIPQQAAYAKIPVHEILLEALQFAYQKKKNS